MNKLTFAGVDLSKWSPEFSSEIQGRWVAHEIPGLPGALQEDLGDGKLGTRVPLIFAGPSAQTDYAKVLSQLAAAGRRGPLLHPLRGARSSILKSIREAMRYTSQGNAITVDLTFEDAALAQPFAFQGGPQAQAGRARELAAQVDAKITALEARVNQVYRFNLTVRTKTLQALAEVETFTAQIRAYLTAALAVGSTAVYLANAVVNAGLGLALQGVGVTRQVGNAAASAVTTYQQAAAQLRGLPAAYDRAAASVRAIGAPGLGQETCVAMEQALHAATQVDEALQAQQPVPIESTVTRSPGQTLYGFIAEKYEGAALTAQQKRALAGTIRQLNRIRNPSFLPYGMRIVRPAA